MAIAFHNQARAVRHYVAVVYGGLHGVVLAVLAFDSGAVVVV